MLTNREKKLIQHLHQEGAATASSLAKVLGVSVKTVHNDCSSINSQYENSFQIIKQPGRGLWLEILNPDAFSSALMQSSSPLPQTRSARILYIANLLLSAKDWIRTQDVSDMLFQSESTISQDLKEVRKLLERYDLSLVTRPKYGLKVEGEELKKRLCRSFCWHEQSGGDPLKGVNRVLDCISRVIEEENFIITDYALQNLAVHIHIALQRIKAGQYVPMSLQEIEVQKNHHEYQIAKKISAAISQMEKVDFPDEENAYICMHLQGKQAGEGIDQNTLQQQDYQRIEQGLKAVSDEFDLHLDEDLDLLLSLALHWIPLSSRLAYGLQMRNPLLEEIRTHYPQAYLIARSLAEHLTAGTPYTLHPDEIGYLAVHINLSLAREDKPKKRILLVCSTGRGTAKLLEFEYLKRFRDYIGVLDTMDAGHILNADFSGYDLVLSTVHLKEKLPIPVIETSLHLSPNMETSIKETLSAIHFEDYLLSDEVLFFNPELLKGEEGKKAGIKININTADSSGIFSENHVAANSLEKNADFGSNQQVKEKILQKMAGYIQERYPIPENFLELVLEREDLYPTSFDVGVAMPHPQHICTPKTFLVPGFLTRPISWGDYEVDVVLMISIGKELQPSSQDLLKTLSRLLASEKSLARLRRHPGTDTLIELMEELQTDEKRQK